MTTLEYDQHLARLGNVELEDEVYRVILNYHQLHGPDRALAYRQALQCWQFLKASGRQHLYTRALARYQDERREQRDHNRQAIDSLPKRP